MAYGSADGVGRLTPRYMLEGTYTTATNPTLDTVTAWLAEVSALVDVLLSDKRFDIPVDSTAAPSAVTAIGAQVNGYVAELARAVNGHGAYGTAGGDLRPITEIYKDIQERVEAWLVIAAVGLERMGATRSAPAAVDDGDAAFVSIGQITKIDGYSRGATEYTA